MKQGNRYYINILNKCNVACPFCCMYSDPSKTYFMNFDTFKNIVNQNKEDNLELQIEGGEPFLHPHLYLFLEYAYYIGVSKINISTNGILINKHLDKLSEFVDRTKLPITLKVSINHHLHSLDNNIFKKCRDLHLAIEFIPNLDVMFNVRLRKDDDWIVEELKTNRIFEKSSVYELQSYGRYETKEEYNKPIIVHNIESWEIFSCDGISFGQDLVARSNYEKTLR